jgi:flagellar assembly protein FliH
MRSSSSVARAIAAAEVGDLARWTPDALRAPAVSAGLDAPPRESAAEAVRRALDEAGAAAAARERELREAEAEVRERLVGEAYTRGYEEGRSAGELGEAARLRTAVHAVQEALEELRAGEIRWTGTIEENVCALAVIVARQVIGRELAADVGPVAELVRTALREFPIDQPIRIRLNPADLNALSSIGALQDDALAELATGRESRWLPDASIAPGGCVVEGRERIVDGRVDTALERVYRRLTYNHV